MPGKQLYISDTLSRAALPYKEEHELDRDIKIHTNMFISTLAITKS